MTCGAVKEAGTGVGSPIRVAEPAVAVALGLRPSRAFEPPQLSKCSPAESGKHLRPVRGEGGSLRCVHRILRKC